MYTDIHVFVLHIATSLTCLDSVVTMEDQVLLWTQCLDFSVRHTDWVSRAVSDEEDEDSECDANSFVLKISFVLR